jgi:hypothetical protein
LQKYTSKTKFLLSNLLLIKNGLISFNHLEIVNFLSDFAKSLLIFPNPASNYITVSHAALDAASTFEIFNIFGEKITTPSNLSGSTPLLAKEGIVKIDVSNLVPGIYFVKVGDKFEKFVKI